MTIHVTQLQSANPLSEFYSHLFQLKRWPGLLGLALILWFTGIAQAAPFGVNLSIENSMDANGNISVINGSKVKVNFLVQDPENFLNKADKIQLLRVDGDTVVSSALRGKKKTGSVSLKVKNSAGEALYVRYIRKGKDIVELVRISHPGNPFHIPLLSIPKANTSDLTIGLNAAEGGINTIEVELDDIDSRLDAVESTLSASSGIPPNHYIRMFEGGVDHSGLQECTDWQAFRRTLVPPHYTCVEFVGGPGESVKSCDSTAVTTLANALRNGTNITVNVDGRNWHVDSSNGRSWFSVGAIAGNCGGHSAIRPCINNVNFGGFEGTSCEAPTQPLGVIFH